MDAINGLKIDLRALPLGSTQFSAELDESFFASLQQEEIRRGRVNADITLRRTSQETFEADCCLSGEIEVLCTVCMEPMSLPVEIEETLKIRFGESDLDDGDIITVQWNKGVLDLSWSLYEQIALSIPIRHVHEECDSEEEIEEN
ncbi:MAG: DUF177 domain-containing protein [Bacteroidaceae bacterium]|nr:DUF177 domain-containing protein [Bacteroidaceae bacterium]